MGQCALWSTPLLAVELPELLHCSLEECKLVPDRKILLLAERSRGLRKSGMEIKGLSCTFFALWP
jgi:hypothetical protein